MIGKMKVLLNLNLRMKIGMLMKNKIKKHMHSMDITGFNIINITMMNTSVQIVTF